MGTQLTRRTMASPGRAHDRCQGLEVPGYGLGLLPFRPEGERTSSKNFVRVELHSMQPEHFQKLGHEVLPLVVFLLTGDVCSYCRHR